MENTGPLNFGRQVRVLVAEDNKVNQMIAREHFKILGVETQIVADGAEVLAAIRSGDFDLILMDCHMPGMDGFETTKKIREHEKSTGRRVPIVALTASVTFDESDSCLAAGMDGFVAKPFSHEQLLETLRRWIK